MFYFIFIILFAIWKLYQNTRFDINLSVYDNIKLFLIYKKLNIILNKANVDEGHTIDHAWAVVQHGIKAINASNVTILNETRLSIILACMLHDADDKKFFQSRHYDNAKYLCDRYFPNLTSNVIAMINEVSCSKNGNSTSSRCPDWFYIPRWADRLEAMGDIGIKRALEYSNYTKMPLMTTDTIIPKSRSHISELATVERFNKYQSGQKSVSTVDHFYDKLLHLKTYTGNPYIDKEMNIRHDIMVNYLLKIFELDSDH